MISQRSQRTVSALIRGCADSLNSAFSTSYIYSQRSQRIYIEKGRLHARPSFGPVVLRTLSSKSALTALTALTRFVIRHLPVSACVSDCADCADRLAPTDRGTRTVRLRCMVIVYSTDSRKLPNREATRTKHAWPMETEATRADRPNPNSRSYARRRDGLPHYAPGWGLPWGPSKTAAAPAGCPMAHSVYARRSKSGKPTRRRGGPYRWCAATACPAGERKWKW